TSNSLSVEVIAVSSIVVSPSTMNLAIGGTATVTATAVYTDNSTTATVTGSCVWTYSAPTVSALQSDKVTMKGLTAGTNKALCTYTENGIVQSAELRVEVTAPVAPLGGDGNK